MALTKTPSIFMVPKHSVVVVRNGKQVWVPIGLPFAFNQEEIDTALRAHPEALRRPIGEVVPEPVETDVDTAEVADPAVTTGKGGKGRAAKVAAPADDDNDTL